MIVVYIKPTGVDRVFFSANSDLVEDSCLAAWPIVRKELKRLDKRLRDAVAVSDDKPSEGLSGER
jgi:hypothetical protein